MARIPWGRLATYGQVADWIGAYGCARQVGWALRRLPLPSPIPWHRVVNAQGRVAMSLSREGSDWMQRQMLIAEGIPVDDEGRLPLKRFLWTPEPQAIRGALGLEPDQSDPLPCPCSLPPHRMADSHG